MADFAQQLIAALQVPEVQKALQAQMGIDALAANVQTALVRQEVEAQRLANRMRRRHAMPAVPVVLSSRALPKVGTPPCCEADMEEMGRYEVDSWIAYYSILVPANTTPVEKKRMLWYALDYLRE